MKKNKELQFYNNIAEYFDNSKQMWDYFSLLSIAEKNYSKAQASKHHKKIDKIMKNLRKKQITKNALIHYLENHTA